MRRKKTSIFHAKFAQVLSSANDVKTGIHKYYMYRGRWPRYLSDMGFNLLEMKSSLIDTIFITTGGSLSIYLSEEFGRKKKVRLYPNLVMDGNQIEWSCYANFPQSQLTQVTGNAICKSRNF